nr:glycosyltransferase [uncultured Enterobacter sp.]
MKILHLSKYYKPYSGGIEQVVADISEGCLLKGIESSVLAVNHSADSYDYDFNGVHVYGCKSDYHYASADISLSYILKLRKIIDDFDVIHVHLPNPLASLALLFARHKNKKIVVHWHSDIVKQKKLKVLYQPLQQWLLKRADAIITTSPVYAEHSIDLMPFRNKIKVIPIGINSENYQVNDDIVQQIKARYPGKKIIFSLGRLVYYKGFEYLVEAAKYLSDEYVILIGGNGEEKNKLINLIQQNNLQDKVKLLGFVKDEELPSYFASCDIFCLPSIEKSEAFGVVQLEAFLFNVPVVSCDIKGSGVGWVNKNTVSGLVVPPKNPEAIAEAFKYIVQHPDDFAGVNQYFKKNFHAEVMVDNTAQLYKEITSQV